jgi:NodT family efflux transporter outer membrane factor (OMF) lipoprotein
VKVTASHVGSFLTPRRGLLGLLAGSLLTMGACTAGPKYSRPTAQVPGAYKELAPRDSQQSSDWKTAQPKDQVLRGKWWEILHDPDLNSLEERIDISNQNLKTAEAQFRQARALVRFNRAGLFPTINAGTSVTGERLSANRPLGTPGAAGTYGDYVLSADVSYEADVWGRVRRSVESARESAQATAADLQVVNLSMHAELAVDYFDLRGLDADKQLLDSAVVAYQKALALTTHRFEGGLAAKAEVAQAETQLKTTQAQAIDVEVQRAQFEHALAVLVGQPASSFALPRSPIKVAPPQIPVGVPSDLLERRPDVAAAERRVAAGNAQIGIARAAYYPTILLSATAGFEGSSISNWISWPSRLWAVGPSLIATAFDVGRRRALTEQAQAAYDANVAAYRQSVLTAFQEVEDNLAALAVLEREATTQDEAVTSAERSLALSTNRYKGGLVTYLEVVTAQNIALTDERVAANVLTRRMVAAVQLMKALGGGWNASSLPSLAARELRQTPVTHSERAGMP